ncbi:MAG TPA: tetratricopeptide repeat protein [Terracidiphilus sp.]|nr:tetratricopeptide repeat protein [Terracidiphilus sp.]
MPDAAHSFVRERVRLLAVALTPLVVVLLFLCIVPSGPKASSSSTASAAFSSTDQPVPSHSSTQKSLAKVLIDYPEEGSIFPPGITPPTFLWRDGASSNAWEITVSFADHSPAVHALSHGQRMQIGDIDPRCVAPTNEPPKLTPKEAEAWTWKPDDATWKAIQQHSVNGPAVFTVTGLRDGKADSTAGHIAFTTSTDPVGAPIFFRDVPLMPGANADGVIQPLPNNAIHLIKWRLRDIREPESHTMLTDVPTCLNCHSFSADGKTMGIDLDGPNNDKGLYAIAPIEKHISITDNRVVQWNTDGRAGKMRVGFMSRISPTGRYALSTFTGSSLEFNQAFYVRNFPTYKFLQVFYPTKGILEWYDRETGKRQPLPGADDKKYVQTGGVWSPDGKWVVFARALAKEPYEKDKPLAQYANDPNETPIQYDLYRVPFNDGKGGTAERIAGASENGMSNSFPKVSPDGKWIVFVEAKNGEVMRPDSQLYIVPFEGGKARKLRANMFPMNSWHSWSPNGKWLVFSSKARGPYTKMYLTHMDEEGNSSPAILIDNATASNRAVNLPEFVNIAGDGIDDIQIPAIKIYRLIEKALDLEDKKDYTNALGVLRQAEQVTPDDARVHNDLSAVLYLQGDNEGAITEVRKALEISPWMAQAHYNLGAFLLQQGKSAEAITELERTLEMNPSFPSGEQALAQAYGIEHQDATALTHWRKAIEEDPDNVDALVGAARILASAGDEHLRNGAEAVKLAGHANEIRKGADPVVLDTLGAAYAEAGKFTDALSTAQRALTLATSQGNSGLQQMISARIRLYQENRAYRD